MRNNIYLQSYHTIVMGGLQISGFAEGDYISVKSEGNAAERTKGGDGPSMNISVSQGGQIELSLMPNSPAIGAVYGLRQMQAIQPQLFSFVLLTGVNELITAGGCAFGEMPAWTTGGPKMTARKFLIEVLGLPMDASGTESIVGSVVASLL